MSHPSPTHALDHERPSIDRAVASMTRTGPGFVAACVACLGLIALGAVALRSQLVNGLGSTGLNDDVSWGLYMVDLIFLMGIGHAGTFLSAAIRLGDLTWGRGSLRLAELLAVLAIGVGSQFAPMDLGRPDRVHFILLFGRIQSPILWDAISINLCLAGSVLYLYAGLIPDLALLAARTDLAPWRITLYRALSLRFLPTPERWRQLDAAIRTLAVTLVLVSILADTALAWVFGSTQRPGWRTSVLAPTFIVAASSTGLAAIIVALAALRRGGRLRAMLPESLIIRLARPLLWLVLLQGYLLATEVANHAFHAGGTAGRHLDLLGGTFAPWTILALCLGFVAPVAMLLSPWRRRPLMIASAATLVVAGGYLKRFLLIIPTLVTPLVPSEAMHKAISYVPSWVEVSLTLAALAAITLLALLFSRVFPIVQLSVPPRVLASDTGTAPESWRTS